MSFTPGTDSTAKVMLRQVNNNTVPWKLAVPRDAQRRAPPKTRKKSGTRIRTKIKTKIKTKIETRRFAYGYECDFHR
jgi:hypothetical protein